MIKTTNGFYCLLENQTVIKRCTIQCAECSGANLNLTKKRYNVRDLPNIENFKFLAILKDGTIEENIVRKDDKGCFFVIGWNQIKGWMKL